MLKLSVSVSGIDELVAKLQGGAVDVAVREATTESLSLLLNRTKKRFLDQVDPEGEDWEPSFAAFRRSFGRGGGTLFDTGDLFHSIQLYSVSPTEGAIGTDISYARAHQFGEGKMVKREFLGFSDEDQKLALKVLFKKISEAFAS